MARGIADRVRHLADPIEVAAGEHHLLQPRPAGAQARNRLTHGADADQKDLHDGSQLRSAAIADGDMRGRG